MDIEAIDSLAEAIKGYKGGLVLVSHDFRYSKSLISVSGPILSIPIDAYIPAVIDIVSCDCNGQSSFKGFYCLSARGAGMHEWAKLPADGPVPASESTYPSSGKLTCLCLNPGEHLLTCVQADRPGGPRDLGV